MGPKTHLADQAPGYLLAVVVPAAILAAVLSFDASAEPMAARVGARNWITAEVMSPGDFGRYADAEPKRRPMTESGQNGPQARPASPVARFSAPGARPSLRGSAGALAGLGSSRPSVRGVVSTGALTPEELRRAVFEATVSEMARGALPQADADFVAPPGGSPHWSSDVLRAMARPARVSEEAASFETRDYSHHLGPWGQKGLSAATATPATASARRSPRSGPKLADFSGKGRAPWLSVSSGGVLLQQGGAALLLLGLSAPIRRRLKRRKADPGLVSRIS